MSTQLEEHETHWVVSTIQRVGRERRMPRAHVSIPKRELNARQAEIIKQIEASRVKAGIVPK